MKKIIVLTVSILFCNVFFGQNKPGSVSDEEKYKMTLKDLKEYEQLADSLTYNFDTTLNLTKKQHDQIRQKKLELLKETHIISAKMEDLRNELRLLADERLKIERKKNSEIERLIIEDENREKLNTVWRQERGYLSKYRRLKRKEEMQQIRRKRLNKNLDDSEEEEKSE